MYKYRYIHNSISIYAVGVARKEASRHGESEQRVAIYAATSAARLPVPHFRKGREPSRDAVSKTSAGSWLAAGCTSKACRMYK